MPIFTIQDEFVDFQIDGEVIAGPVSTEFDASGAPRPRWMKATIYRKSDGSGYVVHQVNESVVWHLLDGSDHVRLPQDARYEDLYEDDVYCGNLPGRKGRKQCPHILPRARPELVLTELPQHKAITCPDVAAVIRAVATARRGDGSVSASVSEPMRDLLTQAAANDPAFRGARTVLAM